MNKQPALPRPWSMAFDETNGIWTINGDDAGRAFPLASISCRLDEHNGRRRHAAHLMAYAEGMYHYLVSRADRGDSDARALVDAIQAAMTANDAEERAMQTRSLKRR